MKVQETTATKLVISDVERLDPISVYLEDLGPERGKVTITCFNESWSYFWGAMGKGNDIRRFFLSCDEHYLAGKFASSLDSAVDDPDALATTAKKYIVKLRRDDNFSKETARDLWGLAEELPSIYAQMDGKNDNYYDAMYRIFGDEWWYEVPKKPNHKYEYLCRIINTVKAALAETAEKLAA